MTPARPAPKDLRIERVTRAAHTQLAARWTVRGLAKIAGMSRAAFVRRFTEEHGAPPLRWLAGQRMKRAASLLVETSETLSRIASDVGYVSEFAFARAFKRHYGVAPGTYRRLLRASSGTTIALAQAA